MSNSTFPARVETSVSTKKGRSLDIRVANPDGDTGNHGGSLTVFQNNADELSIALDTRHGRDVLQEGGKAYATLSRPTAEALCRNLAQWLGLVVVNATQSDSRKGP